jgi:hypothetical protein
MAEKRPEILAFRLKDRWLRTAPGTGPAVARDALRQPGSGAWGFRQAAVGLGAERVEHHRQHFVVPDEHAELDHLSVVAGGRLAVFTDTGADLDIKRS